MTDVFLTVSAVGSSTGALPNDGANFGPDTAGTTTSGTQEAINAIAVTGGIVFCRKGNYALTSPLFNTGNFQTVVFEAGSVLTFGGASSGYLNWNGSGDIVDIWVGCNFVKTGTPPTNGQTTYHDCFWYGNGTTINCTGFNYTGVNGGPIGNGGEQVFGILAYAANSVQANYNIEIDGFTASGFGGAALILATNSLAGGATYAQQWRRVRVGKFVATMALNAHNGPFGSGFIVCGCNGLLVEDVLVDCSNVGASSTPDVSNCFITSQRGGDTQSAVFRRCYFKSGGGSGSSHPGSVLEAQGANASASRGNTHDILWEDCIFDSGAASGAPVGGAGGVYVDDTNGGTGGSRIYNLEFRRCQWVFCGMSFVSQGTQAGYILFNGPEPGALSGSLAGRPVSVGPILPSVYAAGLRVALPKTTPGTIASYTATTVGQFRVTVYVTAKAADTPTVSVTWHDPDTGAQTASPITTALAANGVATAVLDLVADATAAIVVKGSALSSATSLVASATVDQVQ